MAYRSDLGIGGWVLDREPQTQKLVFVCTTQSRRETIGNVPVSVPQHLAQINTQLRGPFLCCPVPDT